MQVVIQKIPENLQEFETLAAKGRQPEHICALFLCALALFDPVMVSIPPGNDFCSTVLVESFPFTSWTLFLSTLLSLIIGATRSLENFLASSRDGCTKRTEPGS